ARLERLDDGRQQDGRLPPRAGAPRGARPGGGGAREVRPDDGKTAERMEPARLPAREPPALRLLVLDGSSMSAFDLPHQGAVVVGRAADAHLRVTDPSVSRRHAE